MTAAEGGGVRAATVAVVSFDVVVPALEKHPAAALKRMMPHEDGAESACPTLDDTASFTTFGVESEATEITSVGATDDLEHEPVAVSEAISLRDPFMEDPTETEQDDEEKTEELYEYIPPKRSGNKSSILKRSNSDFVIPISERKSSWKQLPRPDMKLVRALSLPMDSDHSSNDGAERDLPRRSESNVTFNDVQIRNYDQTVGDNPAVSYGTPISLDWNYEEMHPISLDEYENARGPVRRKPHQMMLNYYNRRNVLSFCFGHSLEEIKKAEQEANKIKRSRSLTKAFLPAMKVEDLLQSAARKTKRGLFHRSKQQESRDDSSLEQKPQPPTPDAGELLSQAPARPEAKMPAPYHSAGSADDDDDSSVCSAEFEAEC